ncbi:HTH_38 domain-containing protein [Trichonephila clavipes]|uniref:HTH_38 domain-containing protein n=1 Tax=Trichonephila clavipes TaxID=2585209 RepID=A0A8X7BLL4_TRICX|nr:HTH_38 domain-containing protein [Trichonephila clavipes]
MSRSKQRSASDQVSEFDRGRTVAYRDCGLSFRKIGSRVGRNQTTCLRVPFDTWACYIPFESGLSVYISVRKTSIAWSTLDAEPQTSPPPMVR